MNPIFLEIAEEFTVFVHHMTVAVGKDGKVVGFKGVHVQGEHIFSGIVVAFGNP